MKLSTALRLNTSPRVAFVGAGGKTSGIFLLARQLIEADRGPSSVFISTTTRMGLFQAKLADHHIIVESRNKLQELKTGFPPGLVLVTGAPVEGREGKITRLNGIPPHDMLTLANIHDIPLLIEADGAKMLPLKAPAAYEPVIPEFCDTVVVLAALSGLGKPLSKEWVHRPEVFSDLSGLALGEIITSQALLRVLRHPHGGLKNIPPSARRIVLFSHSETDELVSIALGIAPDLLNDYHAVVIGSYGQTLARNVMGDEIESIPEDVLSQTEVNEGVICIHECVAGIILAGGASQRYGEPKQLLVWQGQPLIKRVVETALGAGLSPVVVVTGAVDEPIRDALREMPVQIVHNPHWEEGQSTSVKTGLSALPENTGAGVFLLADQPRVTVNLVRALVELHASTLSPIVAPQVAGQRANPVLFDRSVFPEFKNITGDKGGRDLFSRYPPAWVPWHDVNLTLDIDTPDDFQQLLDE
ncbi:MAG: putative selenium-dependent hydroxylase accessory protein YqeC [Anaerolineales bacterium]|nr:putative selenium-dependent hydroxylase accessory protein YqeC [Anaerolineales bacterium]